MTVNHVPMAYHPGYISGRHYIPGEGLAASAAITTGGIRLVPFFIPIPVTITDIGVRIAATNAVGGLAHIAIYANNQATCRPTGNPLASALSLSTTTANTGVIGTVGTPVKLQPGWYWAAVQVDVTATLVTMQSYSAITIPGAWIMGTTTLANCRDALALSVTQAFGAFPDMTGATIIDFVSASTALPIIKVA